MDAFLLVGAPEDGVFVVLAVVVVHIGETIPTRAVFLRLLSWECCLL